MNNNEMDSKYFLPVAVIVGGLLIAGAVVWSGSHPVAAPTGGAPTGTGTAAPVTLTATAKAIAADVKANAAAYQAMADADKAEANKTGVNATPSFVIGTQMIAGAYPYANFKTAIDGVLSGKATTPASGAAATTKVNIKNVKTDGDPYIGSASAPVTVAFWSDFQCPFCKSFELNTFPQIIKDYVDTGKVKVVFMDFSFLGNDSVTAALYSHSVWKLYPAQYLAWRTAMYTAQDAEGDQGFGNADSIDQLDSKVLK